jgi:hypothetical protein
MSVGYYTMDQKATIESNINKLVQVLVIAQKYRSTLSDRQIISFQESMFLRAITPCFTVISKNKQNFNVLSKGCLSNTMSMLSTIAWPSSLFNNNHSGFENESSRSRSSVGEKIAAEVQLVYFVFESHLSKLQNQDIRNYLRQERETLAPSTSPENLDYKVICKGEKRGFFVATVRPGPKSDRQKRLVVQMKLLQERLKRGQKSWFLSNLSPKHCTMFSFSSMTRRISLSLRSWICVFENDAFNQPSYCKTGGRIHYYY